MYLTLLAVGTELISLLHCAHRNKGKRIKLVSPSKFGANLGGRKNNAGEGWHP